MRKNCDDCYWRSEANEDYCFATQNKITNEGCDNYKSSSDICDDMKNKWERLNMKENKELKDLLTTGTIVEVYNKRGKEDIKYNGVVMRDIILYDNEYDTLDRVIELIKSKDSDYYINKVYSPNRECYKLKDLLDYHNSDIIWERNNKPNRLTKEEFAKLPVGIKIIGIQEGIDMEELEFIKIKNCYEIDTLLCLSDYKTYSFASICDYYYVKEEYDRYKKN